MSDEKDGRAAVATLVEGMAHDAKSTGRELDTRGAEAFAREAVERVEKIAAEREPKARPAPAPALPDEGKFTERGDGSGITDYRRTVGSYDFDAKTGTFAPRGPVRHRQMRQSAPETIEDALLNRRLRYLASKPDWAAKMITAFNRGRLEEYRRLKESQMFTQAELVQVNGPAWRALLRAATAEVVKVAEQSSSVFGDWRRLDAPDAPVEQPFAANPLRKDKSARKWLPTRKFRRV